jgi:hypothetical protein
MLQSKTSHISRNENEEFCLPGRNVTRRFGGTYCLHLKGQEEAKQEIREKQAVSFMVVPCLAYSSTVTVEAKCSSEISVDFHRTPWCYVADDINLRFHFDWSVIGITVRTSDPKWNYLGTFALIWRCSNPLSWLPEVTESKRDKILTSPLSYGWLLEAKVFWRRLYLHTAGLSVWLPCYKRSWQCTARGCHLISEENRSSSRIVNPVHETIYKLINS